MQASEINPERAHSIVIEAARREQIRHEGRNPGQERAPADYDAAELDAAIEAVNTDPPTADDGEGGAEAEPHECHKISPFDFGQARDSAERRAERKGLHELALNLVGNIENDPYRTIEGAKALGLARNLTSRTAAIAGHVESSDRDDD